MLSQSMYVLGVLGVQIKSFQNNNHNHHLNNASDKNVNMCIYIYNIIVYNSM